MDERLKQAMRTYLDNRKRSTSSGSKDQYKFPWRAGRNRFVLLPFMHRVEEADLLRSGRASMGLQPEDVGKELPFLVVPRVRFYIGPRGKPTHVVNGIGTPDCPLLQAWLAETGVAKAERKNAEPQDEFVCNVVSMDQPERGVIQYGFKRSEWLGAMNNQGVKVAYGVWDLIGGYSPAKGGPDEPREGEETIGGSAPMLPAVEAWDEKAKGPLIGLKGREIILVKKSKVIGRGPALVVDETVQGGPLRLGPNVALPADFYGQGAPKGVKDLLMDPACYPGWSSNGEHLTEEADIFAGRAVGIRKTRVTVPEMAVVADTPADEPVGGIVDEGQPSPEVSPVLPPPEVVASEPLPRPEGKKRGPKPKRPPADIKVGQTVHWTEDGLTYVGRVYKFYEEAGEEKAEIEVSEEDQQNEKARADVRNLFLEIGPDAVARIPKAKLVGA